MNITIKTITNYLEQLAPLKFQETYDNSGLLLGDANKICTGALTCLDINLEVVEEAIEKKCNLIIAHHPVIFDGIKKILFDTEQGKIISKAIKKDIALYAIHTNLDNVLSNGLNEQWAKNLNLEDINILAEKTNSLGKLYFFVPEQYVENVRDAVFNAGAGSIGNYSECSFNTQGQGTFKANEQAQSFVGSINKRHYENEIKIELIYPLHLEKKIISALIKAHPYEEVAYDLVSLNNKNSQFGSGVIGSFKEPISIEKLFDLLKNKMNLKTLKHSPIVKKDIQKIALCGGSGAFLISKAIEKNADVFITSDLKYHDYFKAEEKIILIDVGHYESEIHCVDLLYQKIKQQFENLNILKTSINTNPISWR